MSGRTRALVAIAAGLLLIVVTYAFAYISLKRRIFPAPWIEELLTPGGGEPGAAHSPPGRWSPARAEPTAGAGPDFGLPYSPGTLPAGQRRGVTLHDESRASGAPRIVVSGHAAEAFLIDAQGEILHEWKADAGSVWPEGAVGGRRAAPYWRRVRLLPGGDLLAIHEGAGLVRLDASSNLVWSYTAECHHDLDLDDDGNILVLERRLEQVPRVNPGEPILVDYIVTLSPGGGVLRDLSVLESFERSEFSRLLDGMDPAGDIFHTNTVVFLDGSHATETTPMFRRGNLLVSLRHLDIVAVIDPSAGRVVWAMTGLWRKQHDPVLVDDGRMLVFDNFAGTDASRVIEIDPVTLEVVWQYRGTERAPFFSETCGTAQRLPGGGTLITESDRGRAFEVTREGEIVWEYVSPYRAGGDGELVATLFEVTVLPNEFPLDFAAGPAGESR